jgi:hypothetical protein
VSRMGDWVLEMQEDCVYMDRGPWAAKHGAQYLYIYDEFLGIVHNNRIAGGQDGEKCEPENELSDCGSAAS